MISRTKLEGRTCSLIGQIVSPSVARELPELTASPTVDTVAPLETRRDGCMALRVNVAANLLQKEAVMMPEASGEHDQSVMTASFSRRFAATLTRNAMQPS